MPLPLKLSDVVEQLKIAADEVAAYLNIQTGELVVLMSDDNLGFEDWDDFAEAESEIEPDWAEEQPQWFKDERALRREVLNSDDYIPLPDKFEIHEWQIMDDFCVSLPAGDLRDSLRSEIRGRGAFRRFHSAIETLQLENAWNSFRDKTLEQIAVRWLDENDIPFVADSESNEPRVKERARALVDDADEPRKKSPDNQSVSGKLSEAKPPDDIEPKPQANENEIKVFISHRDSKCEDCGERLGRQAWITLEENKGAVCLACADLDELVFLPAGDAALTRRSRKYSTLSAVVLKFSKARRQYERQGLLVEENALAQAEAECLADTEVRERRNERARERRAELDQEYIKEFAKRIRALYPNCPAGREQTIAEHACLKYSGRVGRSAAARSFDEDAVSLAVSAHVRHRETNYDSLLADGWFRGEARAKVRDRVEEVLEKWRQ